MIASKEYDTVTLCYTHSVSLLFFDKYMLHNFIQHEIQYKDEGTVIS